VPVPRFANRNWEAVPVRSQVGSGLVFAQPPALRDHPRLSGERGVGGRGRASRCAARGPRSTAAGLDRRRRWLRQAPTRRSGAATAVASSAGPATSRMASSCRDSIESAARRDGICARTALANRNGEGRSGSVAGRGRDSSSCSSRLGDQLPRQAQRRVRRRSRTSVSLCCWGTQADGGGAGSAAPLASASADSPIGRGGCGCFERGPGDFRDAFFMWGSCRVCHSRITAARSATSAAAAIAVADERLVVLFGIPDRRGRVRAITAGRLRERGLVERARLGLLRPRRTGLSGSLLHASMLSRNGHIRNT